MKFLRKYFYNVTKFHVKIIFCFLFSVTTHYYNSMSLTKDVREVALKIKHALLARLPRRRYITGRESLFFAFASHLPTIVIDFVMSRRVPLLSPSNAKKIN